MVLFEFWKIFRVSFHEKLILTSESEVRIEHGFMVSILQIITDYIARSFRRFDYATNYLNDKSFGRSQQIGLYKWW